MAVPQDGIHSMVPDAQMSDSARKLRAVYAITPGQPLFRREFGYYSLDAWKEQGMPQDVPFPDLFNYDPPGNHYLGQTGWCEAALRPVFDVTIVEDRGDYELVQDYAGRHVLYFKGRRDGFMPEYVDHPVKDMRTWQEKIAWRMDPSSPERYADLDDRMATARAQAARGMMIGQNIIGAYMYMRSLIGPGDLLYAFYDMPEVIHACMQGWLNLADAISARHQQYVTLDEVFFGEDICFNGGSLISPEMIREFLMPYYQQLLTNIRTRQIDKQRHLYLQIDTDGYAPAVIPVYRELGMDVMSPFEVASGCDVVQLGRQYPDLVMFGGIDMRVLAQGREAIDQHLEHILPTMRARGGYIPTSDHGVPAEVPYQDYLYYRRRCVELGG
ncbi:MAG: uroporphyrinogen decarboxylase family protein [Anaerolineae bacterium]